MSPRRRELMHQIISDLELHWQIINIFLFVQCDLTWFPAEEISLTAENVQLLSLQLWNILKPNMSCSSVSHTTFREYQYSFNAKEITKYLRSYSNSCLRFLIGPLRAHVELCYQLQRLSINQLETGQICNYNVVKIHPVFERSAFNIVCIYVLI